MNDTECMICLEEMVDNIAVLKCGHKFHFDCISEWANKKNNFFNLCTVCPQENEIVNIIHMNKDGSNQTNHIDEIKKSKSQTELKNKFCVIL